jgi:hypothetical protein
MLFDVKDTYIDKLQFVKIKIPGRPHIDNGYCLRDNKYKGHYPVIIKREGYRPYKNVNDNIWIAFIEEKYIVDKLKPLSSEKFIKKELLIEKNKQYIYIYDIKFEVRAFNVSLTHFVELKKYYIMANRLRPKFLHYNLRLTLFHRAFFWLKSLLKFS